MGSTVKDLFRRGTYAVLYREGTGPEFAGWSDGSLRDGWEAPVFERREAAAVLRRYWADLGWEYDRAEDLFVLNAPPGSDEQFIVVTGRRIDVPRGRVKVYDVGWGWPWVEIS